MMRTILLSLLCVFSLAAQAVVIIDGFEEPVSPPQSANFIDTGVPFSIGDSQFSEATGLSGNVLGGSRDLNLEVTNIAGVNSPNSSFLDIASAGVVAGSSHFTISNTPDISSRIELTWDGSDASSSVDSAAGLLGFDLTEGGINEGILLSVLSIDLSVTTELIIWTSDSDFSSLSQTTTTAGQLFFSFNDFNVDGGSGADFGNINAVQLVLTGPLAFDTQIDFLIATSLPVPPTAWLLLGMLGLIPFSRRLTA